MSYILAHTTLLAPPCPICPPLPTNKGSNQMASEKRLNVSTDCVKDFRPYAPPCPAPPHTTPTLYIYIKKQYVFVILDHVQKHVSW